MVCVPFSNNGLVSVNIQKSLSQIFRGEKLQQS